MASKVRKALILFAAVFLAMMLMQHVSAEGRGDRCGDSSWQYSDVTRLCYKAFPSSVGWNDAEMQCVLQGGHLPIIRDFRENMVVAEMGRRADGREIWIGSAQFDTSNKYTWDDSTPLSFEHWINNVRPTPNVALRCVTMDVDTGDWIQACCSIPAPYLCQKSTLQANDLGLKKLLKL